MKKQQDPFSEYILENKEKYSNHFPNLVREPFYKHRGNYFVNSDWFSVKLYNDFFIETHNFLVLRKLMEENNEKFCFLTYATTISHTPLYKVPIDVDVEYLRGLISSESERYFCWYFISPTFKWACISEYDGDSLFLGYDKKSDPFVREFIESNPDFVSYF